MQPQTFKSNKTHGLLENGLMKKKLKSGQFSVPSDWYFILFYKIQKNNLFGSGEIEIKSSVSKYQLSDMPEIETKFQPTGTYYITEALVKEQEEKVEKVIQQIKEQKVEAAKEEAKKENKVFNEAEAIQAIEKEIIEIK